MQKLSIQEMNRLTPEAFHQAQKLPLVAVLDNVRSQHNIGAVFRTADAFLIEGVCLCGICCCPPNTEIHKTALGAEETVDWQYYADTLEAVADLHRRGYRVYAVEQAHDSITLEAARAEVSALLFQTNTPSNTQTDNSATDTNNPATPTDNANASAPQKTAPAGIAFVLGHEVFGVQQAVVDACDACIEIPQYGTKHSLNVSVTGGIVLYALSTALRH